MTERTILLEVPAGEAPTRLDRLLATRIEGASRSAVRRLLEAGLVRVDGVRPHKGQTVAAGSRVEVSGWVPPGRWAPEPEPDLELAVLYEDADMVVVDKPGGLPCHPLRPGERGTVAGALVARYPEIVEAGPERREAGLVHRLDTGTSGALVFARRPEAFAALVAQVRRGDAEKRYLALVEGDALGLERVEVPLASSGRRAVAVPAGSRPPRGARPQAATTWVAPRERLGPFTLVEATIHAGRRHQIRAHLAHEGHPVAGDRLYGATLPIALGRPFLHALEIRLRSPSTGQEVVVRAPLARDLAEALEGLAR